jgi:hypothetical protein
MYVVHSTYTGRRGQTPILKPVFLKLWSANHRWSAVIHQADSEEKVKVKVKMSRYAMQAPRGRGNIRPTYS